MKKILVLFLISLFACEEPHGIISTTDEKSDIIRNVYKNVSEEKISYLKKVFSEDLVFVDPKRNSLNKSEFIASTENIFDLFEDITFEETVSDGLGTEIETNVFSNGVIWTNVWNTFTAKGKYTGQKISFPFHISYQWKDNKIVKEVQYYDTANFDKEINAKAAVNKNSEKITLLLDLKINKGYNKKSVSEFLETLTNFVRINEPNTYDYNYSISSDNSKITLLEKYKSSEDVILHADNFENGPNFEKFFKMFTVEEFIIAGNSSKQLKDRLSSYDIDYRERIGGWSF
jgi:ketosteroid isomerase-like protein